MNLQSNTERGIAIVGLAGRFPKAGNVDEFWRNLCDGVEGISFFSDEELAAAGVEAPKGNAQYVKARSVLEGAEWFDAAFFGVNPREAEVTDPQHRIFLECAWEALENAGCDPARFDGAIGVFAGVSMNTYLPRNLLTRPELIAQLSEHQLMLGNDKDFLPTRVSYKLNLRGPSLNIQSACSTSLVAVCVACQNLLNYECDLALAGAVSVTFPQKRGYLSQEGGIASPDGHCRPFDAKAAGTVPGDGVGIVALKRLQDALAEGDSVYAVIKGFATNNDGSNKIGYTAPSVEGQAEVIATAQAMAGFAPETIGYVEAHGTGTPLGDPIEIEGLIEAFGAGLPAKQFCAIGSVKSNLGHLDTAAGVAGLIKTALALHHRQLPPSLHFESPNPKIDFARSPFYVNAKLAKWNRGQTPRRAGVSSFGIGGTNAHVVLEEAPELETGAKTRPAQLLLLSAKTETALEQVTANLAAHLKQNPALNLADVAYTLQTGRREFSHRRLLVCRVLDDAVEGLEAAEAKRVLSRVSGRASPPVVFMFPGQGAQQANMGLELYEHEPVFREQLDAACEMLAPHLGFDLRAVLYPPAGTDEDAEKRLLQTAVTQPSLFVVEYALAQLWISWGVQPEAMIGHSVGEYVAACLAGVFSLEDALRLIAARGRLMQQLPGGAMLAVRLPERELKPFLNERIFLAAINAPSLCALSGAADSLETLRHELSRRNIPSTPLQTSHAFHSAMMDPILKPFAELVGQVKLNAPRIPYISNLTGAWIEPAQAADPNYWAEHLRYPVRFADGVGELCKNPERVFLEVGPGHTLSNLVRQHPARNPNAVSVPSQRHAQAADSDLEVLLSALGQLWLSGAKVDWKTFYRGERRRRVELPAYPFERKRFWVEPAKPLPAPKVSPSAEPPGHEPEPEASPARIIHESRQPEGVAQTSSLLYRGFSIRRSDPAGTACRLEVGDTAGWKPALRGRGGRARPSGYEMSGPGLATGPSRTTAGTAPVDQVATALRAILGELSGLNLAAMTGVITFTEMGFDSLFLAQTIVVIEKKLGVRVAFRQLLEELSNLDALAAHLAKALPDEWDKHSAAFGMEPADVTQDGPKEGMRIPLTQAQRELWFAAQISDQASCAYNECRLLRLRGVLSPDALVAALRKLVNRHEALRTTFAPEGDFQQVRPALELEVPLLDWSNLDSDGQASGLDTIQIEEAARAFDLVRGPLLRARLIRLGEHHHELIVTVHHLVCDGHSLGILLRELGEIYSRLGCGIPGELAAPLQLSEYVRRQSREQAARAADEAFWLAQFPDGAPVLDLPTDRPRPAAWTFDGALESRLLPAALGQELKNVGAAHGGTLFSTLLAGCAILLHKLGHQNDLVVGIPVADRGMEGGETLVGHCVNFLPLRLKLTGGAFADFLVVAQKTFLEAYEHQQCTFGSLIQKLGLPRDGSRMPLASVTLNTQRLEGSLKFFGLETEVRANVHGLTHFDLSFNVTELNGVLRLDCRYNASLYSAGTIQRWLGYFQTLLENLAADPREELSDTSLLSPAERGEILNVWSGAHAHFPGGKCLHQLFEEQVERTPEAVAVAFQERTLNYAELNRRANRLAHRLRSLGVGPEVLVALCLERSVELVIGALAILKAGGAYVPIDLAYPAERLAFVLQDTQAPVLVTHRALLAKLPPHSAQVVCVDDSLDSGSREPDENLPAEARPDNLAYVIYTSGSTGRPKGVMVTHQNVARLFHATEPWYQFNGRDVWTLFHSYAFDFSVWETWGALLYGGRLVVVPYLASRSPETFLELLVRERVTVLNQTPSAFRQLMQAAQRRAQPPELALRYIILGGEALELRSLRPWFDRHGLERPRLVNMYGITETTVHVTCRPVSAKDLSAGSLIGAPIPDLQVYILDDRLQPLPVGLPGEIYVGGAGVARGYLNRPELTAQRFLPDPFSGQAGGRLYKTGDRARWLANGDIEYLGRSDDQVKIRGHRIEPGEIESVLGRHPAVFQCVVLAHEDSSADKRLAAYVVPEPDKAGAGPGELRDFLKTKLPDYMIPSAFVFLEALPVTPNGKLDLKALPAPGQVRPEPDESFAAPTTPTETALAEIWREVLRLDRIGIHDAFFDLGGHSLLMTRVISRVREAFNVELPIRRFFESPTIAGLSAVIKELLVEEINRMSDEEAGRLAHTAD